MGGQEDAGCEERLDGSRAFRGIKNLPQVPAHCQESCSSVTLLNF